MTATPGDQQRVPLTRLADFIASALSRVGMPMADARPVGALMAEADVNGSEGHGVFDCRSTSSGSKQGV